MENIIIPAGLGAIIVVIIDIIRRGFPQLNPTAIKIASIIITALASILVVVGQGNPSVQSFVDNAIKLFLVAQTIYGTVWKDTDFHTKLINDPAAK